MYNCIGTTLRISHGVLLWDWRSDTVRVGESDLRWDLVKVPKHMGIERSNALELADRIIQNESVEVLFASTVLLISSVHASSPFSNLLSIRYGDSQQSQ